MQEMIVIGSLKDATGAIADKMKNTVENFIVIGYILKKVRDGRLYVQDGYADTNDYSRKVFGLSRYQTKRFMDLNDNYSVGGYGTEIEERWINYDHTKLTEMIGLPEEVIDAVQEKTTVREIREAKAIVNETADRFSQQIGLCDIAQEEPVQEESWMCQTVRELFKTGKKAFEQMIDWVRKDTANDRKGIEEDILVIVNPSKFKMMRLARANVLLQEKGIRVMPYRIRGEVPEPEEYSYIDFAKAFEEIFFPDYPDVSGGAQMIYEREYGKPLYEAVQENRTEKKADKPGRPVKKQGKKEERVSGKKTEEPGEAVPELPDKAEDSSIEDTAGTKDAPEEESETGQFPGQMEITKDFPEYCPEETGNAEPEAVKEVYACRLLYMASKDMEEASAYMAEAMEGKIRKMKNVSFGVLTKPAFWEEFFHTEVDEEGREIECV